MSIDFESHSQTLVSAQAARCVVSYVPRLCNEMSKIKDVVGKIVFLVLFGYFLVRVFDSYERLNERKIGTATTKKFSTNRDYILKNVTTTRWEAGSIWS